MNRKKEKDDDLYEYFLLSAASLLSLFAVFVAMILDKLGLTDMMD